nr:anoctamin-1a isoform X12 [Syngnathus scovelli]
MECQMVGGLIFPETEDTGSPTLRTKGEELCNMRRSENYSPVPWEKNLEMDNTKAWNDNSIPMKSLNAEDRAPLCPQLGPYFADGQRRVDYVLAYHIQKPGNVCRKSPKFGDDNFIRRLRRSLSLRSSRAPLQPKEDPEIPAQEQQTDYHENDKRFRREEFEENLIEIGLELEKTDECKIPGIGFLKIHAPWNVLCREAEFMKLKMATNKVFEVKQGSNIVEKIRLFIHKVTSPLHPKVDTNKPKSVKSLLHPFSREKAHLFDLSDRDNFFDSKTRSSIVYELLKRTRCTRALYSLGFTSLLANGVYTAGYPPHDGEIGVNAKPSDRKSPSGLPVCCPWVRLCLCSPTSFPSKNPGPYRQTLYEEWASYSVFYKYQPIGLIRKYFGEKVGLYFAWLGVYTQMLIPAAIVGVIVFLYGCATIDDNIPSMEVCDPRNNITMCPLCDSACNYWKLTTACGTARASHLFDNAATVFFAIFMALWAVLFMEHWKRRQMRLNYVWDLTGYGEEEEEEHKDHNRAEYELRVMQKAKRLENSMAKDEKVKLTCTDRLPAYLTTIAMMAFMTPTITATSAWTNLCHQLPSATPDPRVPSGPTSAPPDPRPSPDCVPAVPDPWLPSECVPAPSDLRPPLDLDPAAPDQDHHPTPVPTATVRLDSCRCAQLGLLNAGDCGSDSPNAANCGSDSLNAADCGSDSPNAADYGCDSPNAADCGSVSPIAAARGSVTPFAAVRGSDSVAATSDFAIDQSGVVGTGAPPLTPPPPHANTVWGLALGRRKPSLEGGVLSRAVPERLGRQLSSATPLRYRNICHLLPLVI